MPHPFFDAPTYPWHRQDARNLHEALYKSIKVAGDIDLLYVSCDPGLLPLAPEAAHLMWKAALEALAAKQLLRALGDLLAARKLPAVSKAFQDVANAVNPLEEPVLSSDRVFLNRKDLREGLGKLAQSNSGVSVMLVRGEATSGKTWSKHLVEELAQALGEECIYLCDGLVGTVDDVMDLIFAPLRGKVPVRLTTPDAWFRKVCAAMIGLAGKRRQRYWIVCDDLGVGTDGPRLDPLIRQFFDQVALSMLNPAFSKWFRLLLIDYPDGPLPTKWKGFWLEERTAQADLHAGELSKFLAQWANRKKKLLAEDEAKKFAADILTKADAPASAETRPRLERIHDELLAVLAKL